MSSFLTVWTSASTSHAQSRVADILSAAREGDAVVDSISIAGCPATEIIEKLNEAFQRLVKLRMTDSTLHILLILPLFEDKWAEQFNSFLECCSKLEHNVTLHIFALSRGLGKIFSAQKIEEGDSAAIAEKLKSLCTNRPFSVSCTIIDDYAENGAPIGFTLESLSQYIAAIQITLMAGYYNILSPGLLAAYPGDNLAMGVASLTFDRTAVVRQLLGLGFIASLDNVGINSTKVDAQKAARKAEYLLEGISKRYPALFDNEIRPLYKVENKKEGDVVAQASVILDNDIQQLNKKLLALLDDEDLTLPEKEAILAVILGRDNENIRGMQYQHEGALLDDACQEPLELYINAYNHNSLRGGDLPVRGNFELLKKYIWSDEKEEYIESPENEEAFNPLPDIKRLKQEITNATSFIREKYKELESIEKSIQQRRDGAEIRDKWSKPKGTLKDIEYKEHPLDEKYIPTPGLKPKEAVDMRSFFTSVKNQLDLGSCTSFATTAMYEAMMKIGGVEGEHEMSPAYLYFYSNILKGRPAGGSNFFEQLEVLGTHGICHENLYAYDADSPETNPTQDAEEDAKKHRVLRAKQIPIFNEADKTETIRHNHTLLTSALSEGYPIGISLKIYDNLGKEGAFILHPDDAADAKEEGWHAMVIVGYSEANNFYIVRNSWGREFGEDGYCYIPFAYIDDPEYCNFACIITEISDNLEGAKTDIPTVLANFAATESEIRIAAIRNTIAGVRVDLKNDQKKYAEYYKYYQHLFLQLTVPRVQNSIRQSAEISCAENLIQTNNKKKELENTFVDKLKEYKKNLRNTILSMLSIVAATGSLFWIFKGLWSFVCFIVAIGLCLLTILGYEIWIRMKRRNLQEELDAVAVSVRHQEEELLELQIRFHVAGMWLRRFHDLSLELENVYDRLVSYNSTLRQWQQTYSRHLGEIKQSEGEMFKILDASPYLEDFFERNKIRIGKNVDLIKLFSDYQINPATIEDKHLQLQNQVENVIDRIMGDFNIAEFLMGREYEYLPAIDLQEEMTALINLSQPSYRNKAMHATSPIRIIIADIPPTQANRWNALINPLFPMKPINIRHSNPNTLLLLTIHPAQSLTS